MGCVADLLHQLRDSKVDPLSYSKKHVCTLAKPASTHEQPGDQKPGFPSEHRSSTSPFSNTSTYPKHRKNITSNGKLRNHQSRSRHDEVNSKCCTSPIFKPKITVDRTNPLHPYGQVAEFIISPKTNEIIRNNNLILANGKIRNQNSLVRYSQKHSLIFFSSTVSHQNVISLNFKPSNSIDLFEIPNIIIFKPVKPAIISSLPINSYHPSNTLDSDRRVTHESGSIYTGVKLRAAKHGNDIVGSLPFPSLQTLRTPFSTRLESYPHHMLVIHASLRPLLPLRCPHLTGYRETNPWSGPRTGGDIVGRLPPPSSLRLTSSVFQCHEIIPAVTITSPSTSDKVPRVHTPRYASSINLESITSQTQYHKGSASVCTTSNSLYVVVP